jgi:hypothetical protein
MKKIETRKKRSIRSCEAFVNSINPIPGSRLSRYIEARKEENITKTSDIPNIYLNNGIFFIKKN